MASVKNLKKDINYVLGDIIEATTIWEFTNTDNENAAAIIDEAIAVFDDLMEKVNQKKVENKKQHFAGIRKELEAKANELVDKLNSL